MIDSKENEFSHMPRKKIELKIILNSIGVLISGFLGSIIVMAFLFMLSAAFSFDFSSNIGDTGLNQSYLFPFLLSLVVFLGTTITMLFTYFVLTVTSPESYKKNITTFFHIIFFSVFIYILMIPIYLYVGEHYYESIFLIFLIHNLLGFLLFSIVLELLNDYLHIFLGVYSSFLGTIVTIFLIIVFGFFTYSKGKIYLIIFLIPMLNFLTYFVKQIIEYIYYHYYKYTGNDPIGHVFYQIEKEWREENI